MATTVLTSQNMGQFLETGKVDPIIDPTVKAVEPEKVAEPQVDEADEEKDLPEKVTKIIGKKHRAMKEAQEKMQEAESFAQMQYRERKEAEKRAAEYEARVKALESKVAPVVEEGKEPQRKDFDSDEAFWEAKVDYRADLRVKADRQQRAEEEQQRQAQIADAARIERNKAFAKTVPDYEETVASLAEHDLMVPPEMGQYLIKQPALMYHLAKHPEEFEAISKLPPIDAVAAMGELKAKLEAKPAPKEEEVKPEAKLERPRVPPPIQPLNGSQGAVHKDLREMDTRETIEYWQERDKANKSRRQRH